MGRRGRGAGKAAPGRCQEMSWSVMFLRFRPNSRLQCVFLPPRIPLRKAARSRRYSSPSSEGEVRWGCRRACTALQARGHPHRPRCARPLPPLKRGKDKFAAAWPFSQRNLPGGGGFERRRWGMCGDVMKCHDSVGSGIRHSKTGRAFHRVFSSDGAAAVRRSRRCTRPSPAAEVFI